MIVRDQYKASEGQALYGWTGKELPEHAGDLVMAHYTLAKAIDNTISTGTLGDVYNRVTGPLGLTLTATRELLQRAKKTGYIDSAGLKRGKRR